jgi:hypothetical protein
MSLLSAETTVCLFKYSYFIFFETSDLTKIFFFKGPLECSSVKYTLSFSATSYPNQAYYTRLINNSVVQKRYNYNISAMTMDSIRSNVLGVAVYYSSLSYTQISEGAKMEVADLIGAVGGTLGLFLGLSFLSFYELFELAFTIVYIGITSLVSKKKRNSAVQSACLD